jgi:hypothetical protein
MGKKLTTNRHERHEQGTGRNNRGQNVSALFGFARTLVSLLDEAMMLVVICSGKNNLHFRVIDETAGIVITLDAVFHVLKPGVFNVGNCRNPNAIHSAKHLFMDMTHETVSDNAKVNDVIAH